MLVRELMTPRPEIFAIPESTTIEGFLELLRKHNYSRVPVYFGSLDNIKGLAFAHDLLQITDVDARTRTVATILHPAAFVPETKRGYELLREMQREKQHMRIVIDEYGAVAGLVTIEDLLEQIVGNIRDEHETDTQIEEPQREPSGSWLIPGSFPADQLGDVIGEPVELGEDYAAATVGGLVSEIVGRIPKAGEIVMLDPLDLRVEIVASTGRRVERVRLFPATGRLPFPKETDLPSESS
jgi:putative hemolysin